MSEPEIRYFGQDIVRGMAESQKIEMVGTGYKNITVWGSVKLTVVLF